MRDFRNFPITRFSCFNKCFEKYRSIKYYGQEFREIYLLLTCIYSKLVHHSLQGKNELDITDLSGGTKNALLDFLDIIELGDYSLQRLINQLKFSINNSNE